MKSIFKKGLITAALLTSCSLASAHVWQIGWNSNTDGSLDFYGLSYHYLNGTWDNFAANPAGFKINGTNVSFDLGSAVGLSGCSGIGGATTTCDSTWNALGLDGAITATGWSSSRYRKYASTNLDSAELLSLGITAGTNSVLLTTYANNVDYAGLAYSSASVPLNIVVQPPTNNVPEPASLALIGLGLAGLGFARRKKA